MSYASLQKKQAPEFNPGANDLLIIVDMQKDFSAEWGKLSVPGGREIRPLIEDLSYKFKRVILTKDLHPENHISFASTHGVEPFTPVKINNYDQELWPDHCVIDTVGSELDVIIPHAELIISKGMNPNIDSYSAFYDAEMNQTGLGGYLEANRPDCIYVVGLALDFCVKATARHAAFLGYDTRVLKDYTRGVDVGGKTVDTAIHLMQSDGVKIISDGIYS